MRMLPVLFVFAALAAGICKFKEFRDDEMAQHPPSHLGAVVDVSFSMSPTQRCEGLSTTVGHALTGMNIRRSSQFFLVTTGDKASSYFPVVKLRLELPQASRGAFGDNRSREVFLRQLSEVCATFAPTELSPIFGAVNIALDQLHANGCGPAAGCKVIVISDLLENVSEPVVQRILGKQTTETPLANNDGVDLLICGWAAASGGSTYGIDPEPLKRAWSGLYTQAPRFQPFCDGMGTANPVSPSAIPRAIPAT